MRWGFWALCALALCAVLFGLFGCATHRLAYGVPYPYPCAAQGVTIWAVDLDPGQSCVVSETRCWAVAHVDYFDLNDLPGERCWP